MTVTSGESDRVTVTEIEELINPLREGLTMERAAEPCALVIMGAHGDLTKRKLMPAIYALYTQGLLPHGFCIVGMSRSDMSHEQFRSLMKESVVKFSPDISVEEESWARFESWLYYTGGEFRDESAFQRLASLLGEVGERHGTQGNNIFYLSTPPSFFLDIARNLAKAGLTGLTKGQRAPWPRIVVEKPFGRDLHSARELSQGLHEIFVENQIFRIDHYLGKETVQNIMVLRFANGIFEPVWSRQHVDHVQITNAETIGVEGRGTYYEEAGALRDMIQNHMLQLVALVAMEPPISLGADATRDEKVKVLKSIRPYDVREVGKFVVRGQYGPGWILGQNVPGYREEEGVSPESPTETFAALQFYIDNWRWADVPFYVRSGKRLGKAGTEIAIQFRRAPHRLFAQSASGFHEELSPNVLVLKIQPDEGISLKFATKVPGPTTRLRWLSMDFRYGTAFGVRSPSAYERLLLDCLTGDASLFARTDSVETSWALLEPILEHWSAGGSPSFPNYQAGSWGPAASDQLLAANGHTWRRL